MTRIDDNREAQRVAEQRMKEADATKRRENNAQFQKLMGNKQQGTQQAGAQQAGSKQTAQEAGRRTAQQGGSNALMARQGILANKLNASLQTRGHEATLQSRSELQSRRSDINEKQISVDEKDKTEQKQVEQREDRLAAISSDDRHDANSGLGTGSGGGGGAGADSSNSGSDGGNQAQHIMGLGEAAPAAPAQQTQGAQGPRVPPEVIQKLVDRVFAGVTPEGLSQFTIEFKSDVLSGARLDVVAKDGKISCTFHTDDKNVGNLLKSSEGALARAFAHKGLTLEKLAVKGP